MANDTKMQARHQMMLFHALLIRMAGRLFNKFLTNGICRRGYGVAFTEATGQTRCAYCGLNMLEFDNWLVMSVDHVIPSSFCVTNGLPPEWQHDYANILLACLPCNGFDNRYKPPTTDENIDSLIDF